MNRPVISPAFCHNSSPDHTLEVMQKRIQMAEDETKKLVDQLSDYGFSKEKYEKKDSFPGRIEPISPFKAHLPESPQVEALQKNYERMVSRVCRGESTIQSLKLAMCSLQAERELTSLNQGKNVSVPKDTYDKEIKMLEKELTRCRKELEEASHERDEAKENLSRVNTTLEKTSSFNAEVKVKLEESKSIKQKLTKKVNEVIQYYEYLFFSNFPMTIHTHNN
jgi:DNA repair ATPase RecN